MIRYTSNSTKTYNTNSRKPMDDAASLWPGKLKDSSTISLKRRKKKKKSRLLIETTSIIVTIVTTYVNT